MPKLPTVELVVIPAAGSSTTQLFRAMGFSAVNRPEGASPRLPTRVAAVTTNKLGDMQIEYAAWREYSEDLHAEATTTYMQVKSDYDFLVAITSNGLNDTRTVKDKSNMVLENKQVQRKRLELLNAETMLNLLGAKLNSYTNALQVLSRELTRRGITNF